MGWLTALIASIVAALAKVFIQEAKKPKETIYAGGDPDVIKDIDDDITNAADNS